MELLRACEIVPPSSLRRPYEPMLFLMELLREARFLLKKLKK